MFKEITFLIIVLAVYISILVASAFITTQYTHQADIQRVQNEINQVKQFKNSRIVGEANRQLSVHPLMSENRWVNSFVHTSSKIIAANQFGLMQMSVDHTNELTLFYYMIPRWFTENYMFEHNTLITCNTDDDEENFVEQYDDKESQSTEDVYGCILALKVRVVRLVADNYSVVQTSDQQPFVQDEWFNQVYFESLKHPSVVAVKSFSL